MMNQIDKLNREIRMTPLPYVELVQKAEAVAMLLRMKEDARKSVVYVRENLRLTSDETLRQKLIAVRHCAHALQDAVEFGGPTDALYKKLLNHLTNAGIVL